MSLCVMQESYAAEKRSFILDGQAYHLYKNEFESITFPQSYVLHKDPTLAGAQIDSLRKTDEVFNRVLKQLISTERVRYFNDRDRNQTIVTIEDGVCKQIGLGKEGSLIEKMEKGLYIFVIKDNKIYAALKKGTETGKIQHSSFFSGENVQSAGKIKIDENGCITMINRYSGHYKPTLAHLNVAKKLLKSMSGLKMTNIFQKTVKLVQTLIKR